VTCVRLKKTCVYETVQAPSRIAKLKDRIGKHLTIYSVWTM